MTPRMNLGCAALVVGDAGEAEVEEAERKLDEAVRDRRRLNLAVRELGDRLGLIRDPVGNVLNR